MLQEFSLTIKKIVIKLNLCGKQFCMSDPKSKFFNIHQLEPHFDIHKLGLPLLNLAIDYANFDILDAWFIEMFCF